jgi:hypothetical protein
MSTSNLLISNRPQLIPSRTRELKKSGPAVPAGCAPSDPTPPERCLRCFADISNLWHVAQLCDDCVEWETRYLQRQNAASEERERKAA